MDVVFLDRPLLGTGWHGELPSATYTRYLPDARDRFADQPPHYFPLEDGTFVPQQTYDQVLYQLGLIGAALLLVLSRWPCGRHSRQDCGVRGPTGSGRTSPPAG